MNFEQEIHTILIFFFQIIKKKAKQKLSIFRPATHPDLIGISRFFSANLEVSRIPNFTCGNPGFLFRFGRLTLLHGPCHQAHQEWAKNKFL